MAKKLKEVEELSKAGKFEQAAVIIGRIFVNYKGATSYELMRLADLSKNTAEKLAKKNKRRGMEKFKRD